MIQQNSKELIMNIQDFSNLGYDFVCRRLFGNRFVSVAVDPLAGPLGVANKPINAVSYTAADSRATA